MRYNRSRQGRRDRDFQQSRVYRAERIAFGDRGDQKLKSRDAVHRFVKRVVSSQWFGMHAPVTTGHVCIFYQTQPYWKRIYSRSPGSWTVASVAYDRVSHTVDLWLPKEHWTKDSVLHELSHVASMRAHSSHGPAFCSRLIEAHKLFGRPGNWKRLQDAMEKTGARWSRDLWRKA